MKGKAIALARLLPKFIFEKYREQVLEIIRKGGRGAKLVDNALRLAGLTLDELLAPSESLFQQHDSARNNPHGETPASIGTYSSTHVQQQMERKLPAGAIPVSSYGVLEGATAATITSRWSVANFVLSTTVPQRVVFTGVVKTIDPQSIDLRTVDASPANKTFYVYITLRFGIAQYMVSLQALPDTYSRMYIGKISTNSGGGGTLQFETVVRIDLYRISQQPVGSAIPVTGGTFDAPVKLPTGWKPT